MRTLGAFVAVAATGCIISEPEGTPQFWPPQLGGIVEAVVAADLDANGSTEVVVMMTGEQNQAGLYYLESGVDLVWESGDLVRSFSRFVPAELVHPVAAFITPGAAPRIYVATGEETLTLTQYANNLTELDRGDTDVPGGGNAWVRPITFPGGMGHVAVSNGVQIDHLDPTLADERPLPPPPGSPGWNLAQTATSYTLDTSTVAVVATAEQIYRTTIPTMPGSPFAWEAVRTTMEPWLGQVPYDLDGDGHEEIVGLDLATHQVCAVKVDGTVPVAPSCIPLQSTFPGTDVTLLVGTNLSMSPGPDILVVQATGTETAYSLIEDYRFVGGELLTDVVARTIPVAGPPRGRTVLGTPGLGRPHSVLTFGTDGAAVCIIGPC